MTDQDHPDDSAAQDAKNRGEQRMMWIFSGSIVLLILGAMGANMLFHKERPATPENTDISAQSRTAPSQ